MKMSHAKFLAAVAVGSVLGFWFVFATYISIVLAGFAYKTYFNKNKKGSKANGGESVSKTDDSVGKNVQPVVA